MILNAKKLHHDARLTKAHRADAAYDLFAIEDANIESGDVVVIPTGIAIEIPVGYVGLVCPPRSGKSLEPSRLDVANAPGIIDPGYTGEVKVIISRAVNLSCANTYRVRRGDRVAQLLIVPAPHFDIEWVKDFHQASAAMGGLVRLENEMADIFTDIFFLKL
jgi:dUTP pyrophosphatase